MSLGKQAAYLSTEHVDYGKLAARIAVSNLHKETDELFLNVIEKLHKYISPKTQAPAPLIADDVYAFIKANHATLQAAIDYTQDFKYSYFGFRTLERGYLLKCDAQVK